MHRPQIAKTAPIDLRGEVDAISVAKYRRTVRKTFDGKDATLLDMHDTFTQTLREHSDQQLHADVDLHINERGTALVAAELAKIRGVGIGRNAGE